MQGASRESLAAAHDRLDEQLRGADLRRVSDELFSVAALLDREFALRRALSDPSTPSGGRADLLDRIAQALAHRDENSARRRPSDFGAAEE